SLRFTTLALDLNRSSSANISSSNPPSNPGSFFGNIDSLEGQPLELEPTDDEGQPLVSDSDSTAGTTGAGDPFGTALSLSAMDRKMEELSRRVLDDSNEPQPDGIDEFGAVFF